MGKVIYMCNELSILHFKSKREVANKLSLQMILEMPDGNDEGQIHGYRNPMEKCSNNFPVYCNIVGKK